MIRQKLDQIRSFLKYPDIDRVCFEIQPKMLCQLTLWQCRKDSSPTVTVADDKHFVALSLIAQNNTKDR